MEFVISDWICRFFSRTPIGEHVGLLLVGVDGVRCSAERMDEQRHEKIAYEYLCHLEETKKWLESCIVAPGSGEQLPASDQLEEALRNGVYLARLAHHFDPVAVPLRKIYDLNQVNPVSTYTKKKTIETISTQVRLREIVGRIE